MDSNNRSESNPISNIDNVTTNSNESRENTNSTMFFFQILFYFKYKAIMSFEHKHRILNE